MRRSPTHTVRHQHTLRTLLRLPARSALFRRRCGLSSASVGGSPSVMADLTVVFDPCVVCLSERCAPFGSRIHSREGQTRHTHTSHFPSSPCISGWIRSITMEGIEPTRGIPACCALHPLIDRPPTSVLIGMAVCCCVVCPIVPRVRWIKVDFECAYQRLKGKNVLFPFGYHCTGMPICAAADRLKREVKEFGNPPQFPEPKPEAELAAEFAASLAVEEKKDEAAAGAGAAAAKKKGRSQLSRSDSTCLLSLLLCHRSALLFAACFLLEVRKMSLLGLHFPVCCCCCYCCCVFC